MSLNLDNIRRICVKYETDEDKPYEKYDGINDKYDVKYLTSTDDADKLLGSIIKLHHTPGVNPHNNGKCTKLKLLVLQKPNNFLYNSYWWTSPTLEADDNGAKILNNWIDTIIYRSSELEAELSHCYKEEAEYELMEKSGNNYILPTKVETVIESYINTDYEHLFDRSNDTTTTIML
jgi:hypothetical protein